MSEALDMLEHDKLYLDALRIRAYPFCDINVRRKGRW
jgi:hypothetical protein